MTLHPKQFKGYVVHTWHDGDKNKGHRMMRFSDFDSALEYGEANNPDSDGSMLPQGAADIEDPHIEKGLFYYGVNKYGIITGPNGSED